MSADCHEEEVGDYELKQVPGVAAVILFEHSVVGLLLGNRDEQSGPQTLPGEPYLFSSAPAKPHRAGR